MTSYLFLPYPSPIDGALNPILVPGWTLNYEMLFYVLFLMVFLFQQRLRPLILAVASWLLIAGVSLGLTYLS